MELKEIIKLEGEIWRPVVGWEGLYEVSNFGRVASLNYKRTNRRKILLPQRFLNGYQFLIFTKEGSHKSVTVHRIVGMAFQDICGTYSEGLEIDHINTVRDDNRASNLRWCTRKENCLNPITRKRKSETHKGKKNIKKTKTGA